VTDGESEGGDCDEVMPPASYKCILILHWKSSSTQSGTRNRSVKEYNAANCLTSSNYDKV